MEFAFIKSSQKGVGFFLLDQGTNYPKPPVIVTTNEYFRADEPYLTMYYLLKMILGDLKYTFKAISIKENFCAPLLRFFLFEKIYSKCKERNRYSFAFASQTEITG